MVHAWFASIVDVPVSGSTTMHSKTDLFESTVWPRLPLSTIYVTELKYCMRAYVIKVFMLDHGFLPRYEMAKHVGVSRNLTVVIPVKCHIVNRVITRVADMCEDNMYGLTPWLMRP